VAAAVVTSTGSIATLVMGRATRDALFLSSFDVARLPGVMIVAATASLFAALWVGSLVARHSPAKILPMAFAASGALFAAQWAVASRAPRVVGIALYLQLAIFGATLVSMFWSTLNERFDARTAKRYVAFIAGGGTAGGILGGMGALGAAHSIGARTSLLVLAFLHMSCAISSWYLGRVSKTVTGAAQVEPTREVPSALRVMGEVSYLRQLALLVATMAAMEALADYVLNAQAAATWSQSTDLMAFFAVFHTAVAYVTLILQTVLGRAAVQRLGLVGTVALLPLFAIPGAALAAFVPALWSAGLLRGGMAGVDNSLYRTGYELLFNPLPIEKKRPTKTVIDVAFDRLGTAAGSSVALAIVTLPAALARPTIFGGIVVLALVGLYTVRRLNTGYVRTLEENLKAGYAPGAAPPLEIGLSQTQGRLDGPSLLREIESLRRDNLLLSNEMPSPLTWYRGAEAAANAAPDPLLAHSVAFLSGDAAAIRAELGAPELDPRLVPLVIPLLNNEELAQDAVRALRSMADRITGQLTDALLDPLAPFTVRRRVARVMSSCTTQRAVDGLVLGLGDDRFEVRYQCGLALLRMTRDANRLTVAKDAVLAAVKREVLLERKLWEQKPPLETTEDAAETGFVDAFLRDRTSRSLEHVFAILSLVFEREPMRLALRALSGEDEHLRGTALEYLEQVLPVDVKNPLWPFLAVPEHAPTRTTVKS
jgi:hypothetical protein